MIFFNPHPKVGGSPKVESFFQKNKFRNVPRTHKIYRKMAAGRQRALPSPLTFGGRAQTRGPRGAENAQNPSILKSQYKNQERISNTQLKSQKQIQFIFQNFTILYVRQNENVLKKQLIAECPFFKNETSSENEQEILSTESGEIYFENLPYIEKTISDIQNEIQFQKNLVQDLGGFWILFGRSFQHIFMMGEANAIFLKKLDLIDPKVPFSQIQIQSRNIWNNEIEDFFCQNHFLQFEQIFLSSFLRKINTNREGLIDKQRIQLGLPSPSAKLLNVHLSGFPFGKIKNPISVRNSYWPRRPLGEDFLRAPSNEEYTLILNRYSQTFQMNWIFFKKFGYLQIPNIQRWKDTTFGRLWRTEKTSKKNFFFYNKYKNLNFIQILNGIESRVSNPCNKSKMVRNYRIHFPKNEERGFETWMIGLQGQSKYIHPSETSEGAYSLAFGEGQMTIKNFQMNFLKQNIFGFKFKEMNSQPLVGPNLQFKWSKGHRRQRPSLFNNIFSSLNYHKPKINFFLSDICLIGQKSKKIFCEFPNPHFLQKYKHYSVHQNADQVILKNKNRLDRTFLVKSRNFFWNVNTETTCILCINRQGIFQSFKQKVLKNPSKALELRTWCKHKDTSRTRWADPAVWLNVPAPIQNEKIHGVAQTRFKLQGAASEKKVQKLPWTTFKSSIWIPGQLGSRSHRSKASGDQLPFFNWVALGKRVQFFCDLGAPPFWIGTQFSWYTTRRSQIWRKKKQNLNVPPSQIRQNKRLAALGADRRFQRSASIATRCQESRILTSLEKNGPQVLRHGQKFFLYKKIHSDANIQFIFCNLFLKQSRLFQNLPLDWLRQITNIQPKIIHWKNLPNQKYIFLLNFLTHFYSVQYIEQKNLKTINNFCKTQKFWNDTIVIQRNQMTNIYLKNKYSHQSRFDSQDFDHLFEKSYPHSQKLALNKIPEILLAATSLDNFDNNLQWKGALTSKNPIKNLFNIGLTTQSVTGSRRMINNQRIFSIQYYNFWKIQQRQEIIGSPKIKIGFYSFIRMFFSMETSSFEGRKWRSDCFNVFAFGDANILDNPSSPKGTFGVQTCHIIPKKARRDGGVDPATRPPGDGRNILPPKCHELLPFQTMPWKVEAQRRGFFPTFIIFPKFFPSYLWGGMRPSTQNYPFLSQNNQPRKNQYQWNLKTGSLHKHFFKTLIAKKCSKSDYACFQFRQRIPQTFSVDEQKCIFMKCVMNKKLDRVISYFFIQKLSKIYFFFVQKHTHPKKLSPNPRIDFAMTGKGGNIQQNKIKPLLGFGKGKVQDPEEMKREFRDWNLTKSPGLGPSARVASQVRTYINFRTKNKLAPKAKVLWTSKFTDFVHYHQHIFYGKFKKNFHNIHFNLNDGPSEVRGESQCLQWTFFGDWTIILEKRPFRVSTYFKNFSLMENHLNKYAILKNKAFSLQLRGPSGLGATPMGQEGQKPSLFQKPSQKNKAHWKNQFCTMYSSLSAKNKKAFGEGNKLEDLNSSTTPNSATSDFHMKIGEDTASHLNPNLSAISLTEKYFFDKILPKSLIRSELGIWKSPKSTLYNQMDSGRLQKWILDNYFDSYLLIIENFSLLKNFKRRYFQSLPKKPIMNKINIHYNNPIETEWMSAHTQHILVQKNQLQEDIIRKYSTRRSGRELNTTGALVFNSPNSLTTEFQNHEFKNDLRPRGPSLPLEVALRPDGGPSLGLGVLSEVVSLASFSKNTPSFQDLFEFSNSFYNFYIECISKKSSRFKYGFQQMKNLQKKNMKTWFNSRQNLKKYSSRYLKSQLISKSNATNTLSRLGPRKTSTLWAPPHRTSRLPGELKNRRAEEKPFGMSLPHHPQKLQDFSPIWTPIEKSLFVKNQGLRYPKYLRVVMALLKNQGPTQTPFNDQQYCFVLQFNRINLDNFYSIAFAEGNHFHHFFSSQQNRKSFRIPRLGFPRIGGKMTTDHTSSFGKRNDGPPYPKHFPTDILRTTFNFKTYQIFKTLLSLYLKNAYGDKYISRHDERLFSDQLRTATFEHPSIQENTHDKLFQNQLGLSFHISRWKNLLNFISLQTEYLNNFSWRNPLKSPIPLFDRNFEIFLISILPIIAHKREGEGRPRHLCSEISNNPLTTISKKIDGTSQRKAVSKNFYFWPKSYSATLINNFQIIQNQTHSLEIHITRTQRLNFFTQKSLYLNRSEGIASLKNTNLLEILSKIPTLGAAPLFGTDDGRKGASHFQLGENQTNNMNFQIIKKRFLNSSEIQIFIRFFFPVHSGEIIDPLFYKQGSHILFANVSDFFSCRHNNQFVLSKVLNYNSQIIVEQKLKYFLENKFLRPIQKIEAYSTKALLLKKPQEPIFYRLQLQNKNKWSPAGSELDLVSYFQCIKFPRKNKVYKYQFQWHPQPPVGWGSRLDPAARPPGDGLKNGQLDFLLEKPPKIEKKKTLCHWISALTFKNSPIPGLEQFCILQKIFYFYQFSQKFHLQAPSQTLSTTILTPNDAEGPIRYFTHSNSWYMMDKHSSPSRTLAPISGAWKCRTPNSPSARPGTSAPEPSLISRLSFPTKAPSDLQTQRGKVHPSLEYPIILGSFIRGGLLKSKTQFHVQGGQMIAKKKHILLFRKATTHLLNDQSILHIQHGDMIWKNQPLCSVFYNQSKTGDIVQGIPKIEEIFEARKKSKYSLHELPIFSKDFLFFEKIIIKYLRSLQKSVVNNIQRIYCGQGIHISDKHIEIIVRQMTSNVLILEPGQTGLLDGEIVALQWIHRINVISRQVIYEPVLIGMTKTCLETSSFLSAASFQETTRILGRAALQNQIDFIRGLKQNVILGNLIPIGTGCF